ncbi:MAG: 16S rRNA (adenine(1518)-N(6)/adenine(1519)-N(6))-dimethyltransferase RsmA [Gammaproteobacteria bacterium]|nr:MAG: 16S rRNA (adenine(1518)-N(6)/adenine(1519)-N(6))-dimethyltransferase RsmA [Gammaproteobacteria bacterium]
MARQAPAHRPRKRFGQHFLHDPGVIERILQAIAPAPGQALVEIGPGQGALTRPLLERAGALQVIEIDRDLAASLAERLAGFPGLQVHRRDALVVDFCALYPGRRDLRLVGNLPYNLSTPLLFHALEHIRCLQDMHFMLQKEVVARMAAAPGGKDYGRLSVMVQYHCRVQPLFDIGPGAFAPPPRVRSSLVRLTPHARPPVEVVDEARFAAIVRAAFGQRRKTLRNALQGLLEAHHIEAAGVDPSARAEQLDLAAFARLANA